MCVFEGQVLFFIRNDFLGRLADNHLDLDGHFIWEGPWVLRSDGHDMFPVVRRHQSNGGGNQRHLNVRLVVWDELWWITFQSDRRDNRALIFADQKDRPLHIRIFARNLHLKVERSNFRWRIGDVDVEARRFDHSASDGQKFIDVPDGPEEIDNSEVDEAAFSFENFGADSRLDLDLRRHFWRPACWIQLETS